MRGVDGSCRVLPRVTDNTEPTVSIVIQRIDACAAVRVTYLVKNASSSSMLSVESTNSGWLTRPTTIITRWELCLETIYSVQL